MTGALRRRHVRDSAPFLSWQVQGRPHGLAEALQESSKRRIRVSAHVHQAPMALGTRRRHGSCRRILHVHRGRRARKPRATSLADDSLTISVRPLGGGAAGRLAGCRVGGAAQSRPPDAYQRDGRVRLACQVTPGTVFARSDRLLVKTRRAR